MSLILISLGVMLFLSVFSVVLGESWSDFNVDVLQDFWSEVDSLAEYVRPEVLSGGSMGIDNLTGAITIIVIFITLGAIIGIQVLGSGLSDTSVRTITLAIVYIGVWTSLTFLAGNLIFSIEEFGTIIYVSLTLVYAVGCIQKIAGGGVD
jgi:hypothetical protein